MCLRGLKQETNRIQVCDNGYVKGLAPGRLGGAIWKVPDGPGGWPVVWFSINFIGVSLVLVLVLVLFPKQSSAVSCRGSYGVGKGALKCAPARRLALTSHFAGKYR